MRISTKNKALTFLFIALLLSTFALGADDTGKSAAPKAKSETKQSATPTPKAEAENLAEDKAANIGNLMLIKDYITNSSRYLRDNKRELVMAELSYAIGLLDVTGEKLAEADAGRFLELRRRLMETSLRLNGQNLERLSSTADDFILFLQGRVDKTPADWDSTILIFWIKVQNYIFVILGLATLWLLFSLVKIMKTQGWKRMGILMVVVIIPVILEGMGRLGILTGLSFLANLSFMTNEYTRLFFALIVVFAIFYSRLGFKDIYLAEERLEELTKDLKTTIEEQTKEISFLLDATTKTSQTQDQKEIIKLFSEMLIRSFSCHTFSRVAIMDKSKEYFEVKHISSLRPMNVESLIDRVYPLDSFPFLKKAVKGEEVKMIAIDSNVLDKNEIEFLFQNEFRTSLILPFVHGQELLGFGLVCEARSPERSHFTKTDIEFYKTLANHLGVSIHNAQLFAKNKSIFLHTIQALAAAVDARDSYTLYHSRNVTEYSVRIAEEMDLPAEWISTLKTAGLLHDIGKIGIRDEILLKCGKLTEEELKEFTTHSAKAVKILESVDELEDVIDIVAHHHERYNGEGYPEGLQGEDIPMGARIIAVADAYDAMTSSRTYRKPVNKEEAIEEIKKCSGTQFDTQVVEAFLSVAPSLTSCEAGGEGFEDTPPPLCSFDD